MTRRYYLVTLGCPKNEVDSEGIDSVLRDAGYLREQDPRAAELLIVNTCGFVQAAREESLEALRELASQKSSDQLLIAAGCMADQHRTELSRRVPELAGIIGTQRWEEIPDLLARLEGAGANTHSTELSLGEGSSVVRSFSRFGPARATAYLKIADGCSLSCAFCSIPMIKGPQRSKPSSDVLREARELVAGGVKEIVLIGQDSTGYRREMGDADGLPRLLEEMLRTVPQVEWLRIMYAYPQHVTDRLIELMSRYPQVCHYLDMPLQHGHPDVLRRMGRPADVDRVLAVIRDLRVAVPDVALRSTFIVGYPGETDEEFSALLEFMERVRFDRVGVFKYSREKGTRAYSLGEQIPEGVKEQRFHQAMMLQQTVSLLRNRAQIGRELNVLMEGTGDGLSVGRSYRDAPEIDGLVLIEGELPPGRFVNTRIVDAMEYDLVGEVIE